MTARYVVWAASMLVAGLSLPAWPQAYPAKPVRFLVGFAAGGSVDILGRIYSQKLSESMGQQIIVENRPGAGSNIAGAVVAKAPPDGYTLFVGSAGGLAGNLAIYQRMPYNPLTDFSPISVLAYQANILVVNASLPTKNVREFIALARNKPSQINVGSGGNGSSQHLSLEAFMKVAGVKMLHVPYKGGAPAVTDLLGGQIDAIFAPIPEAMPHLKAGKIRALGVTGAKRAAALPGIPTIREAGLPGYEFDGFMGLVGPAALPQELVARLNREVNNALGDSAVKTRLIESGLELGGGSPETLANAMRVQAETMIKLAKDAGIKPVD
ncbi:MAG: Tricarboxylate transport protein TctC [Betaproteobacteria bacterium]|nr:Tricarboxylate transport protein TctC [Betaproteobacteria bacterium]